MKSLLVSNQFALILAQTAGGLAEGASKAMGIVMLIGFIFGTICVVGGGFAIRRGDTDAGKLSIIGGLIIAGAPVIVKALFADTQPAPHPRDTGEAERGLPRCR